MFSITSGNVTIKTIGAPKRGTCLEATNKNGEKIYMDFCGMNPMLVPDGSNAYLFGNKLIIVTRWSDMSDEEKQNAEKSSPVTDVIISKVTVETFGEDFGKPKTLEPWDYYQWIYETYGINLKQN